MSRVILLAMMLLTTVVAQSQQRLQNPQDVAERLNGVRLQVLYVTPVVDNKVLAEALRRAVVERGVKVYILVSPEWVEAPGSYAASLASLEGVQVRMAAVERSFALLDVDEAAVVLEGSLLGSGTPAFVQQASYALTEAGVLVERSARFADVWEVAMPYLSWVDRLESPELEPEVFDWSVLGGL